MKMANRRITLLVLVALLLIAVGYGTLAQNILSVPDPMQGINPTPLAYPNPFPAGYQPPPLPPGVRDPVASIMPRIPMVIRPDENPYNYALANPTNLTDPMGLSPITMTNIPQNSSSAGEYQTCQRTGATWDECAEKCYRILERIGPPGSDRIEYDFHRCMNECLGRLGN